MSKKQSLGQKARDNEKISSNECRSMRLLRNDGYTKDELVMMFMLNVKNLDRHLLSKCNCDNDIQLTVSDSKQERNEQIRNEYKDKSTSMQDLAERFKLARSNIHSIINDV